MEEKFYKIGISCIGSGVGQSVINSLRLSRLPIKTIGFGTNPFGYGAYDCDAYDYTPTIYADDYIEKLVNKCKEYKIDLLIPGLDDEVLIIAQNINKLNSAGIKVICADSDLVMICRNKAKMSAELNKIVNVFVNTFTKSALLENVNAGKIQFPFIAKPRSGFASRGIVIINAKEDLAMIDDNLVIQELAIPAKDDPNYDYFISEVSKKKLPQVSEVSIQLVYGPDGKLIGRMASYNKLNNGIPIEVLPFESKIVWDVIDKLVPALLKFGLKGPLNIQGRMTDSGLKLFEMNPRFTGITGLRALMGFNEVEACVKEWLGIDKGENTIKLNQNRFGVRQTSDKSIPIERNERVFSFYTKINGKVLKKKKTLLITDSCGYLGYHFINELLNSKSGTFDIWAFDLDKIKLQNLYDGRVQYCFDKEDLEKGRVSLGYIDILLHFGSACSNHKGSEIADGLQFANELFTRAVMNHVPAIINISSQSVYGHGAKILWNENTPVAPATLFAQEKYASELLLQSLKRINNQFFSSSLRLGTIVGGEDELLEDDLLTKIVGFAYKGKTIHIRNSHQEIERLDIRDAVLAFLAMIESNPTIWKPIYNLGSCKVYKLIDLAEKAVDHAIKCNGGKRSEIIVAKEEVTKKMSMDSSLFMSDLGWKPKYNIEDTIDSIIYYYRNRI